MTDPPSLPHPPVRRLLTGAKLQAAAAVAAPGYGRNLTDTDWERIAERLEALARLLWEFSERQARDAAHRPSKSSQVHPQPSDSQPLGRS
jgi:hypothetical protein